LTRNHVNAYRLWATFHAGISDRKTTGSSPERKLNLVLYLEVEGSVRLYFLNFYLRQDFLNSDTGAIYTTILASLLEKLNIKPTSTRKFKLANGKVERHPLGEAYVEVAGEEVTLIIVFLPEGSTPPQGYHIGALRVAS
jgi:hypothetical protein